MVRHGESTANAALAAAIRVEAEEFDKGTRDPDVGMSDRDRDTGILHGLTALGVRRRHPAEHRERERLGRFYYRPPGGESWPDVALRLRPLLPELSGHTLVFTHDIVIVMTRYILANLTEPEILKIESTQLANASITRGQRTPTGLRLTTYNDTTHLNP